MMTRAWSHAVVAYPGGTAIVVSETLALAFKAGPDIHGYGLKLPRYVVLVSGDAARAWDARGRPAQLEDIKAVCPDLPLPGAGPDRQP